SRIIKLHDASKPDRIPKFVDCVITSPPYMSGLDYARDNRLRLWFCGVDQWKTLEGHLSPSKTAFAMLMKRCVGRWQNWLRSNGHLAIVLGDINREDKRIDVAKLVLESVSYTAPELQLVSCDDQVIPNERRLIKGNACTLNETTLIFRRRQRCC